MSKFRIDYEIEGVERTMTALRRGIREGMEASADDLIDRGEAAAKDRIYNSRRVWTREVYKYGWGEKDVDTLSPTRVTGRITNYSDHAYVVDEGYDPKWGQPPVQNILPWVDSKVQGGWTMGGDDGGSGPDPLNPLDSSSVVNGEATIEEMITGQQAGFDRTANQDSIRVVTYESGDRGLFKSNNLGSSAPGSSHNEEVYSKWAERMGWDDDGGFPVSRQQTITDEATGTLSHGDEITGNMMAFVEDGRELHDTVSNYWEPEAGIPVEDFAEDNMDWIARVGVLDYLIANYDRHGGNVLLDSDNQPWAIDSGGHGWPAMNINSKRRSTLLIMDEFQELDRQAPGHGYVVEEPERMKAISDAILDRQAEIFEELRDVETREEFIEIAQQIHPDDSAWDGHFEDLLDPDSTARYRIYGSDEWNGKELWKYDLDELRTQVQESYEGRVADIDDDSDVTVPWQNMDSDSWTSESLDSRSPEEILSSILGDLPVTEDPDDN